MHWHQIQWIQLHSSSSPRSLQGSPGMGWKGRISVSLEDDCSQAGKVPQWYSQFLPWVSAGSSIPTSAYITSHSPYPQTPCSVPINHVLRASSTLLSITVLHDWRGIWKTETHSSSPNSPVSSCSFISTEKIHSKLRRCGRHRPWAPLRWQRSTALWLLLCWSILMTWSAQQTTKQSSTVIYTDGIWPTLTAPDIRPSRMISLSRTNNFCFQGKKLNWQSKPFVKHTARNNTFSFKRFFTASSLQIFALSLQKIPKKFSVYSISESHNLQKNK